MKFSLWNFRDWYATHGVDLSHLIMDNSASISMLATSPSAAQGRLGCALVQSGDAQPDSTGFRTVLRFGNDRILFPIASAADVLNLGNAMIAHYTGWENALFDQIASGCSIDELLTSAQQEFPFPMALMRMNGSIQSHTADWNLPLSPHMMQSILSSASQHHNSIQPFFSSIFADRYYTFLADTISIEHEPTCVLIAYESSRKLQPGDVHIFHTLSETVETAISFQTDRFASSHPLSSWFSQAVNSEDSLSPVSLNGSTWSEKDYYQLAVIQPVGNHSFSQLISELTDADHCCITVDNLLAVLIHLESNFQNEPEYEYLSAYCSEKNTHIGFSLEFRGLSHIYSFYQQALWALHRAQESGVHKLSLVNVLPDYILQSFRELTEMQAFIHPDILRLAAIDHAEGEHLLQTLYTYLIFGCSSSQTADALFIHRNTLRTRIKRIRSLLSISPDEPEERNQLLLSLILYSGNCT